MPNVDNSRENRAFKHRPENCTCTVTPRLVDRDFTNLLAEELGRIRGKRQRVNCRVLMACTWVCTSTSQNAVINPQHTDQQCLKQAILAIYVVHNHRTQVDTNYSREKYRHEFFARSASTPVPDIKIIQTNESRRVDKRLCKAKQ